jgi:dihydrofolate reductase
VVLIAAVAENGVIGDAGTIPWHLPDDFAHFKATTMGHTLVMGRATYESIGRPLPGRTTVVLSRDPAWAADGVRTAGSFEEALALAVDLPGDVYVAGGAAVYALALPHADEQLLTEVRLSPPGDTSYPPFDRDVWVEAERTTHEQFDVVRWVRRDR